MIETTSGRIQGIQLDSQLLVPKSLEYSEEIASDQEYHSEGDEMGELSDSHSSQLSFSRPVTPSNPPHANTSHPSNTATGSASRSTSPSKPKSSANPDHFTLAHKAERILGLQPGTLPHARACLENARDEARRTASPPPTPPTETVEAGGVKDTGMRNRVNRARKAMSVALPNGVGVAGLSRMGSVVVGTGGKAEEEMREKRRRATDGVLYWQKEIARLESEERGRK